MPGFELLFSNLTPPHTSTVFEETLSSFSSVTVYNFCIMFIEVKSCYEACYANDVLPNHLLKVT